MHSTTVRTQRPGELWNIKFHGLAIRTYMEADARDDFAGTQLALWCDRFGIPTGTPLCEAAHELLKEVRAQRLWKEMRADPHALVVANSFITNKESLLIYERAVLASGHEGVMIRSPGGLYKEGRSTVRDGILGKIKRFTDAEATVIGVTEKMHNANPATKNALGQTERSSHKAGKVPTGTMGNLVVRDDKGREFEVGTGFTDADRAEMWANPPIGKIVKYKSMDHSDYDKPRHAVFLGFRDPIDC